MAYSDYLTENSTSRSRRGMVVNELGPTKSTPIKATPPKTGLVDKARSFVTQSSQLIGKGVGSATKFTVNTPKYVYEDIKPFLNPIAQAITGTVNDRSKEIEGQRTQLDGQLEGFHQQYKSGKMSRENWTNALKNYNESMSGLNKSATELTSTLNREKNEATLATVYTAVTIMTGGRLSLSRQAASRGAKNVVSANAAYKIRRSMLDSVVKTQANAFEKTLYKVPAFKDVLFRNMAYFAKRDSQRLAGESAAQFAARNSKELAIGFLLKRPILYQTNVEGAQDVYEHLATGDYDDAVRLSGWLSLQMVSGGPLGAAAKLFRSGRTSLRPLVYGGTDSVGSYIDNLSKHMNGSIAERLQHLKDTGNFSQFRKEERAWRVMQEVELRMAGDDAAEAASRTLDHWDAMGFGASKITPEEAYRLVANWVEAEELKNAIIRYGRLRGVISRDPSRFVVVRWDVNARNELAEQLRSAGSTSENYKEALIQWASRPGNAAGQNHLLLNKLEQIIDEAFAKGGNVPKNISKEIKGISAVSVLPKGMRSADRDKLAELGYTIAQPFNHGQKITPAVDYRDTRKLITALQNGDTTLFNIADEPEPSLHFFNGLLRRMGLSMEGSTRTSNRVLAQTVVAELNRTGAAAGLGFSKQAAKDGELAGRFVLSRLQRYIEEKQPNIVGNTVRPLLGGGKAVGSAISDIRQLSNKNIMEALSVDEKTAAAIRAAIIDAHTKVPLEFRGLGDKVVDYLYKINPAHRWYARAQSALRYNYNPFFGAQERFETSVLSRAEARSILWTSSRKDIDDAVQLLDNRGVLKTGLGGEAAQDVVLGRITANITNNQKRNLAGLALSMAKRKGITLDEMLTDYSDEVADALRVIVQYPNRGVLNSSLARTLNVAFFPMRYNVKVTAIAASLLAKEPPSVQLAVINSLFTMRDWLKSDEGIAWQAEYADAIQVMMWLSPLGSIQYTLSRLTHAPDAPGDMGSLGGLPLGVLTQILDSQGIITLNTPYVNPETGDVLPKYIPETTKARAATALTDILNSTFTYPGRVLGLPGKQQTINNLVREFIDTNGTDFEKRLDMDRLTPLQQNMVRVLKGDTSEEAIDALYRSPADGQFDGYTLPPLELPLREAQPKKITVAPKTLPTKKQLRDAKKAKNGQKNIAQPIR